MKPRWKEIEAENPWLETQYYEYDESPEIIEKYNLQKAQIPVFIFLDKNGNEITRLSGEPEKKDILKIISANKDK